MKDIICLTDRDSDLEKAASLLKSGKVVALPTETVYGLAADATNCEAVASVFAAKGRPADNPLIIHVTSLSMMEKYTEDIPRAAYRLAEAFWPGPLTMILPKKNNVPEIVTGGLDTVAVRMPSHPVMRKIIDLVGKPLAAPSANLSGSPSPTTLAHVRKDMNGRIEAVVDGGECTVGVESTVICFDGYDSIRILRPGFITAEDLRKYVDEVIIDENILSDVVPEVKEVRSPGMKYKHYSPAARVVLVCGDLDHFIKYAATRKDEGMCCLIYDQDAEGFPFKYMTYGSDSEEQAKQIFSKLREADEKGVKNLYVRAPQKDGVGLAVYNRLIRAAGYEVVET
ncbi:L-threonylcarbamoyladenylate synthase [Ruminococcus sp. HUN007]|uniref:L-threonylcarbamoyladenylate synthase n=1 Tax=Ruminococcus sp. HUN007 TaxID=1514668 RepID=UPI0005D18908|nr:L-threonylcarbamoyladenylate synthase [Ruminococcus sp. HUN007]